MIKIKIFSCSICVTILIALLINLLSLECKTEAQQKNTEGFIEVEEGIKLHYSIIGSGPDTVVIPMESIVRPYVSELSKGRRIILYDSRDRGLSDEVKNPELISMEKEINDLEMLRQHFKLKDMTLIGWSMYGSMVAQYAAEHPENVRKMILVSPMPIKKEPYSSDSRKSRTARVDILLNARVDEMIKLGKNKSDPIAFCKAFFESGSVANFADTSKVSKFMDTYPCDCRNEWPGNLGLGHLFRKLGEWDLKEKVKKIRCQSLVIHGKHDNIPEKSSEEWASTIPDSRLILFEESGHYPFVEEPQKFNKVVNDFLNGEWPKEAKEINVADFK